MKMRCHFQRVQRWQTLPLPAEHPSQKSVAWVGGARQGQAGTQGDCHPLRRVVAQGLHGHLTKPLGKTCLYTRTRKAPAMREFAAQSGRCGGLTAVSTPRNDTGGSLEG